MKEQLVKLKGNRILKIKDYPGEKGVILVLHGLTGNCLQLRHYIEEFNPRYRVISLDFRGRGDSGKAEEDSSIFEHAKDIQLFIKEFQLTDVILMGYSMGAFISALVATNVNLKGLILLDGAGRMSNHQNKIVEPTFTRLSSQYLTKEDYILTVTENYKKMGIEISEKLIEAVSYEVEEKEGYWENKACEKTIRQDWNSFWLFDIRKIGTLLKCPTLLVEATGNIGSNPPLFLPEDYVDTKKSIQGIQVKVSDASHYTMVFEKREDIINYINQFLNLIES